MHFTFLRSSKSSGFTLIELLIVVAIISILAAIAVPNFLEAQVRAKVSRVKADMRTLTTALESYTTDHNTYPFTWPWAGWLESISCGIALSTPVAYITNAQIRDPFNNKPLPLAVRTDILDFMMLTGSRTRSDRSSHVQEETSVAWPRDCYAIVSVGPDGLFDVQYGFFPFVTYVGEWVGEYDPTNGTKSRGEIYRCNPRLPKNWVINTGHDSPGDEDPFAY